MIYGYIVGKSGGLNVLMLYAVLHSQSAELRYAKKVKSTIC
jgi:hypothetical protein